MNTPIALITSYKLITGADATLDQVKALVVGEVFYVQNVAKEWARAIRTDQGGVWYVLDGVVLG